MDLANGLNANLLRRWVVAEERAQAAKPIETVSAAPARSSVESRTFLPDPGGEFCGHSGTGSHDRATTRRDGSEGRLAVGRGGRLRGLVA